MVALGTIVYAVLALIFIRVAKTLWEYLIYFCKMYSIGKVIDKIPGPPRDFFFGTLKQIPHPSEAQLQWHIDQTTKYKTCFSFKFGPLRPAVALCHPSTLKVLLKTSEPKPLSGKGGYALILDWLGMGLLLNGGKSSTWFRNRRLLTPAFHFDVLKPYVQIYNEATDIFLEKMGNASRDSGGKSVEIFHDVSLSTLNVMMRCAFSYEDDIQRQGTDHPYVKAVSDLARLFIDRIFNPLMYPDAIFFRTKSGKEWLKGCDYAHQVAYGLIQKRKKSLEIDGPQHASSKAVDFLDILLLAKDDNGEGLTELEIRQEVDTFLFEGHDTTASGLAWCMYNFACHPEFQERARKEVDGVLEGRNSDHINWDDLGNMPYLTMCIKESMRHTPPVPFVGRELENSLEIDGFTLPPGTFVDIYIWSLHHNPHVWGEDHMEYKPDRFLPENIKEMDSHAFLPFSAGPRNCIGQNFAMNEMKTFMARVLRKFVLEADPKKVPERRPEMVMRAMDGIHLVLKARS